MFIAKFISLNLVLNYYIAVNHVILLLSDVLAKRCEQGYDTFNIFCHSLGLFQFIGYSRIILGHTPRVYTRITPGHTPRRISKGILSPC